MRRSRYRLQQAVLAALPALVIATSALAQDHGGLFDNMFNRSEPRQDDANRAPPQDENTELSARVGRIENALRQLTGTIEELQHQNQMLQQQLQQLGARGGTPVQPGGSPMGAPPAAGAPTALPPPGRRSDVFDPNVHPDAPGAPRTLNSEARGPAAPVVPPGAIAATDSAVGVPNGRDAGAPLDLNSVSAPPAGNAPPARMANPPDATLATLPPSARPQDEYDMAYGYVLHKDYGLATQAFRDFIRKYPQEHLVSDAQYWLGESLYQQQRYRDAAEAFLTVSTKYERSGKAPDALLRLGQSLAAMHQKEAACATLAEVGRKYPKASAGVKRGVAQEQKRAHC
jgi:tol-pal system protein YbgF